MDPYLERILGILTAAPTQRTFLKRQHAKASKAFEVYHRKSDFILAMESGNLLLAQNDEFFPQEIEAKKAQGELDESTNDEDEYEDEDTPNSEVADPSLNRLTSYVCLGWLGLLGFVALCSAIGW